MGLSGSPNLFCLRLQLGAFQTWRIVDSFVSKAPRSADGAGCSWIFTARWSDDERIRLQMADITRRSFIVRQHGGGRQGTMVMRVTALSGRDGKHTAILAMMQPVMSRIFKEMATNTFIVTKVHRRRGRIGNCKGNCSPGT